MGKVSLKTSNPFPRPRRRFDLPWDPLANPGIERLDRFGDDSAALSHAAQQVLKHHRGIPLCLVEDGSHPWQFLNGPLE